MKSISGDHFFAPLVISLNFFIVIIKVTIQCPLLSSTETFNFGIYSNGSPDLFFYILALVD